MYFDPSCLTKKVGDLLDAYGITAEVTFRRVDTAASAVSHELYAEIREADRVHKTWTIAAQVEEDPRANRYGRGGGEVEADLLVNLYNVRATSGTEAGSDYEPAYEDQVVFRDEVYEVTGIKDIQPTGKTGRLGVRVEARKHR